MWTGSQRPGPRIGPTGDYEMRSGRLFRAHLHAHASGPRTPQPRERTAAEPAQQSRRRPFLLTPDVRRPAVANGGSLLAS